MEINLVVVFWSAVYLAVVTGTITTKSTLLIPFLNKSNKSSKRDKIYIFTDRKGR